MPAAVVERTGLLAEQLLQCRLFCDLAPEVGKGPLHPQQCPIALRTRRSHAIHAGRTSRSVAQLPLGQRVVALPEGDRYLGFVFARGAQPGEVEAALRAAQHELDVHIEAETAG